MPRRTGLILFLALMSLVALLAMSVPPYRSAAQEAGGDSLLLLDHPGVYTLRQLGSPDITLAKDGGVVFRHIPGVPSYRYAEKCVPYRLPEGAHQGPDLWYVVHFHYQIIFPSVGQSGEVDVEISPNFWPASLTEFKLTYSGNAPRIAWSDLGLIDGLEHGSVSDTSVERRFSNYVPYSAVVAGTNCLWFGIREDRAVAEVLRVFDDTSIEITPLSPPQLAIEGQSPQWPSGTDGSFEAPYTVRNTGGWPVKDVTIQVSYPKESLQLLDSPTRTVSELQGSGSESGVFTFKPRSSGVRLITVTARDRTGGQARANITALITEGSGPAMTWRYWGLLAVIIVASAIPLVFPRHPLRLVRATRPWLAKLRRRRHGQ